MLVGLAGFWLNYPGLNNLSIASVYHSSEQWIRYLFFLFKKTKWIRYRDWLINALQRLSSRPRAVPKGVA